MKDETRFYVQRLGLFDRFAIWLQQISHHESGRVSVAFATTIQLRTRAPEEEGTEVPPAVTVNRAAVQGLMDELWQAGIRPSDQPSTANVMPAMNAHRQDMRALVRKAYRVEL